MTEDLADASAALDRDGFVILERRLEQGAVTDARNEIEGLLAKTSWGSGFDGDRTRRVWALLAKSRCMDDAALDSLVLALADHAIGPGAQFSLTQATQIHPGQAAQPLHYEQGIYPIPRDRDVMVTAIWALDDFTAENGGTLVVPGSHAVSAARPASHRVMSIEMPAGSVLVFRGRLWHAGGSNTTNNPRLGVIIDYAQPWLRPVKRTLSPSTWKAREAYHSDSKNSLASTRRRPT
jgi:hypothetical protein